MTYQFLTTCEDSGIVGSYGEDITEMTASCHAMDIDSESFMKLADKLDIKEHVLDTMNFSSEKDFINDWGVECNKSKFQGLDCLFIKFSHIEHIFIKSSEASKVLSGDEAEERRDIIEALDEELDKFDAWQKSSNPKEKFKALSEFVKDNINVFKDNNILLASLFAYGHNYGPIIKKVDDELLLNPSKEESFDFS